MEITEIGKKPFTERTNLDHKLLSFDNQLKACQRSLKLVEGFLLNNTSPIEEWRFLEHLSDAKCKFDFLYRTIFETALELSREKWDSTCKRESLELGEPHYAPGGSFAEGGALFKKVKE